MLNPWLTSLKAGTDVAMGVAAIYQQMMWLQSSDCPQPDHDARNVKAYAKDDGERIRLADCNPADDDCTSWIEAGRTVTLEGAV